MVPASWRCATLVCVLVVVVVFDVLVVVVVVVVVAALSEEGTIAPSSFTMPLHRCTSASRIAGDIGIRTTAFAYLQAPQR